MYMQNLQKNTPLANNHISVDCVVIGFDGEQLKVLLVKRAGEDNGEVYHDMKLPGSLIYMDEALDEAAQRVLYELTGLKNDTTAQNVHICATESGKCHKGPLPCPTFNSFPAIIA
jgi:ADP-ribose pyrophosphatase YjhB (NUDIX family)